MNKQSKYKTICIYLGLAVITIAAFQQLRICDFVNYDDPEYVTENQNVNTGVTAKNFIWAFTSGHASNWHPLTWLSHMLDCQLFDLNPKWHHFVNLLLHIINALLLFAVFKQMTASVWPSAFVAATFAIHPLHVCSVAWISERKDVLSTLFWLLTMAAYFRYAKTASLKWYLLTLAAFALGLMAKPMLVTLPFVLLLLDYWPLKRIAANPKRNTIHDIRNTIFEKLPFFILSAVSSIITYLVQQKSGVMVPTVEIPLRFRIINALTSYLVYIEKMIWPSNLAIFYPYPRQVLPIWHALIAALLLAGVSVAIVRLAQNHKYLIIGWLWYLGTLAPVIGLVQVGDQAMADRYTYIPLTGLFIIIAWGADELTRKLRLRKALLIIASGIILAAMLICTHLQVKYWRNSFTLFGHALEVTKDNYLAHNNIGVAFQSAGNADEAIKHYQAAIEIVPGITAAYNNLGFAFQSEGDVNAAIKHYQAAIKVEPDVTVVHYNLGNALKSQGRLDEAISQYRQALKIRPDYAKAHNNLGSALHLAGRLDEAIGHFQQAIQLQPDYAETYNNLGIVLLSQHKNDEAIKYFRQAIQLKPDFFEAYSNIGVALAGEGKFDEAIESFQRALKIRPDYNSARRNLASVIRMREESKNKKPTP